MLQLFILLRQPANISVTVFPNTTKLTNYLYKPYTLVGPTVTRPIQKTLAVVNLNNRLCMLTHEPQC